MKSIRIIEKKALDRAKGFQSEKICVVCDRSSAHEEKSISALIPDKHIWLLQKLQNTEYNFELFVPPSKNSFINGISEVEEIRVRLECLRFWVDLLILYCKG